MKKILITDVLAIIALIIFDVFGPRNYCSVSCLQNLDGLFFNWLVIAVMIGVFLMMLSILPNKSYEAWWRFTKFALPVFVLLVSAQIYTMNLPQGGYQVLNFDLEILSSFYAVYILISLIQIYRGYRQK